MGRRIVAGAVLGGIALAAFAQEAPVFHRDVQPILQSRCQACHMPGGIAPFPLVSYEDAAAHGARIGPAVESRLMPPWKAAPGCQSYEGDRSLPQAEIDTLLAWLRGGAPAGDPADARTLPVPADGLPWVDLTLDAGEDYLPSASHAGSHGADDYRCFALDPALAADRDLVGIDVLPGVARQVHHVLLFTASPADVATADAAEPGLGWTCFGGPGTRSEGTIGGWAPGGQPLRYPAGTGITLRAGQALVMQVHYNLSHGAGAPERTRVRLQFSRERVERPARLLPLADLLFRIPPGARDYTAGITVALPVPATVWGVAPHMHTLGKRIRVETETACLVDVPAWDFRWQQGYLFAGGSGIPLPAGTRLKLTCTFDNPTSRSVGWGEGTADEMCLAYLYLTS